MSNGQSLLTPGSLGTPTPTSHSSKKFSWERPRLRRNASAQSGQSDGHRVTFSNSSKGSAHGSGKGSGRESDSGRDREYSSQSDNSRPPTPPATNGARTRANEPWVSGDDSSQAWQKVDRKNSVAFQTRSPPLSPPPQENRPFLVYNDAFLSVIGSSPSISCLIHDTRGAYFHNSGIYSHKTSTFFISSAPFHDDSPSMAPSRNLNSTITKIDFFSSTDHSRDKVRTPDHTYMIKSGCAWKTGVVMCAQGTLKEPAALIYMDAKRPHRNFPLLTNFNGIPLNSPWACIAHADGSLWFSDPHLHHSPNFRPRPRLPPMIYRFDPASSDLRAMCSDIAHPTALAFAPDYKALYVLDGTPPPSSQSAPVPLANTTPMLYAFTVSCFGGSKAPFLTHKRLFAFTTSPPTSVTTDSKGNVYVGCQDGVHVFDVGGSLIGRVAVEGGVTGLCFGRTGELWVSANERIWRVQLHQGLAGSVPRGRD